jgi:signal transduction histidine kinase
MQLAGLAYASNEEGATVTGLAVLLDAHGSETIETVSQPARTGDFVAAPHGFSAGYTRQVHWLRFTLKAPPPARDGRRRLLVEFYPPYLDKLAVYLARPGGQGFDAYLHGDQVPFSARLIRHRAFVQGVDFPDAQPIQVYLRLQTSSSSVLVIDALTPDQFIADSAREYVLLGVFFGLLAAGLLANLRYAFRGDPLQRAFLIHLTTTLYMLFAINGLLAQYVFQDSAFWADRGTSIGSILVVTSATYFYGKVLEMARAAFWMRSIYRIVMWMGVLFLPAPFIGFYPETQRLLIFGALLVVLTGMWRSMQLYRQQSWGSLLIVLALLSSLLGASAATLTLLGMLPGQFWLINSYTISTLGTLAALQAYFMLHARQTEKRLLDARMDVGRAAAVLETERASREGQRRFLAMLTHELKTPLAALHLCLGQLSRAGRLREHAENAIEQIDSVIERCDLASRFDDGRLEITRVACSLHELIAELITQRAGNDRIQLTLPQGAPIVLQTDPTLLRTILDNLISNALKYSPGHSTIQVLASHHSQAGQPGVVIRVENPVAGPAMRPAVEQVFTKYYRAPQAQHSTGSGLGLYLVRGLCTMLGGHARYFPDQPNVIFEVWIPV